MFLFFINLSTIWFIDHIIWFINPTFVQYIYVFIGQFIITIIYYFFLIIIFSFLIFKYIFFVFVFWTKVLERFWRLINYVLVYCSIYDYFVFSTIVLYEGQIVWLISFLVFCTVVFSFAYSGEVILISPLIQNPFDMYPPDVIVARTTLYDKFIIITEEHIYPALESRSLFLHIFFYLIIIPPIAIYG